MGLLLTRFQKYRQVFEQKSQPPRKVIFFRYVLYFLVNMVFEAWLCSDGVSEGQFKTVLTEGRGFLLSIIIVSEYAMVF